MSRQLPLLISAGLVLLVLIAFEPLRYNTFITYDDNDYITENPQVLSGLTLSSIRWAFTTGCAANWHPLTWLSHMVDIELFKLNPVGHHLHNLALHTISTVLLFWILSRMTGSIWPSAFTALVFGIHPLRVESVAWAAERKDVLCTLFWMLTLLAYLYYVKKGGISRYLLVVLCFALGLMAKPMIVTLPVILLLLDYWPLGRISQKRYRLIIEKIPLLILTIVSCVITYQVQQHSKSIADMESFPILFRILNAGTSYIAYLGKTFWPQNLVVLYPFPESGFRIGLIIAAFAGLLLISVYVVLRYRQRPYLLAGWLWYIVTLIPVIGLVHVGSQRIADRYTYLPSIGIYVIIAWAAADLSSRRRRGKIITGILSTVIVMTLIVLTRVQLSHWRNSIALYEHTLAITSDNPVIESNLGMALLDDNRIQEASEYITRLLASHPDDPYANINMALILIHRGQSQQAVGYLRKALQSPANNVHSYFRIGMLLQSDDPDTAITAYEKTLGIHPHHAQALNNLGILKSQKGLHDEAVKCFSRSIQIDPSYVDAHFNFAALLQTMGRTADAAEHYRAALSINPNDHAISFALASLYVQTGEIREAIDYYRKTLRLKSDFVPALNDLAWLLAATSDNTIQNPSEAITLAQKACQLTDFKSASQLDTLAVAYAAAGKFQDAAQTAQMAIETANSAKQSELALRIAKRLELYRDSKPYYELFPSK